MTISKIANTYAAAVKIIALAIEDMGHPSLKREDLEGNAAAILARLAQANILLSSDEEEGRKSPRFNQRAADRLAYNVAKCVDRGVLDARSGPADALLDYLQIGQTARGFSSVPDWIDHYENRIKR